MEIFSRPDYYPSPSSNVITYSNGNDNSDLHTQERKSVVSADIYALIVYLSSPIDTIDYSVFSDFFLVYREFITPLELHELLVSRFKWAIIETLSQETTKQKLGQIALVRAFVLLRHSILNDFVLDFLNNQELRLFTLTFLNDDHTAYPKIVQQTVVNLKKLWIHTCKTAWDNISWNEPQTSETSEWLIFKIKDITQLNKEQKRNSRLSLYAIQGSSNPNFRNESMISLFNMKEPMKFQTKAKKTSKRTGSMLLFPNDNSNIPSTAINSEKREDEAKQMPPIDIPTRKISRYSKQTHMSTVIKDVDYPTSPKINRIIPPTPAKKVEFILKSLYVPDQEQDEDQPLPYNPGHPHVGRSTSISRSLSLSSVVFYKGALGLLTKWKKNHISVRNENITRLDNNTNPEMDTFVKYVISITSLDYSNSNQSTLINGLTGSGISKFDILSARTIEEVEYLISLENDLLKKVKNEIGETDAVKSVQNFNNSTFEDEILKPGHQFSAMDNLDLYKTVSTIAQSVISLSNTLNKSTMGTVSKSKRPVYPNISPSTDRRKLKSSSDAILSSKESLSLDSLYDTFANIHDNNESNSGPERLVFQDSETSSTPSKRSPTKSLTKAMNSSPLKHVLPRVDENFSRDDALDYYRSDSHKSSVSYDSQLSATSPRLSNQSSVKSNAFSAINSKNSTQQSLNKKNSIDNLREFTFEDEEKKALKRLSMPITIVSDKIIQISSPLTADSEELDDISSLHSLTPRHKKFGKSISPARNIITEAGIRPASGRISIAKRHTIYTPEGKKSSVTGTPASRIRSVGKDPTFIERDNILFENELKLTKLEEILTKRESITPSVATSKLFNSRHNSPQKTINRISREGSGGPRIRLSIAPSMNSILSGSSLSSSIAETSASQNGKIDNLRDQFQKAQTNKDPDFETSSTNKYFFSPGSDSLNAASPEKDVELLKNKFLQSNAEQKSEVNSNNDIILENSDEHNKNTKFSNNGINPTNLKDIADMPDDSIHDDPVNIAMMKLEGIYKKEAADLIIQSSPDVSNISKEVELLNLDKILAFPKTPAERRRSLLIERRRKTIMNIPYTPGLEDSSNITSTAATPSATSQLFLPEVQKLMSDYTIQDPNLLITNNQYHIPFILMYDSLSIAQQLTLIEKELLTEIDWKDLLDLKIKQNEQQTTSWLQLLIENETLSGVDLLISRFNLTVAWIISEISLTQDVKMRRNTIQRFIHVADHCRKFQNYNTLMEIILALNSVDVQKMIDAWRLIEPGDFLTWEELKRIPSLEGNYSVIRNLLNEVDPLKGCIPFIAVYLSDLSINSEKDDWIEEGKIVNYSKFDIAVQTVKNFIQKAQWSKFYDFKVDHELLSKCVYISALSQDEIDELNNGLKI